LQIDNYSWTIIIESWEISIYNFLFYSPRKLLRKLLNHVDKVAQKLQRLVRTVMTVTLPCINWLLQQTNEGC